MMRETMKSRARVLLSSLAILGCDPGSATVSSPDSGSGDVRPDETSDTRVPLRDGSPDPPDEDVATPGMDSNVPDDDVASDMPPPDPDLPPMPSRVWTAETDGTIAWWTFDPQTSTLTNDGSIEQGGRITFLALSDDRTRLYATNQDRVEAFDVAELPPTFLGSGSVGAGGTHLEVDRTGGYVFVASYGGDQVSMLPLDANGAPMDASVELGGANAPDFCRRAHQARVHPSNDFVYVPCLGSDHVAVLAFDAGAGTLEPQPPAPTPGGSGPRHMDFHPGLAQAYVIGEQDDTVTRFRIDEADGSLEQLDVVSTRPDPADPLGPASDIHVSADGDWVLGVNRDPRNELVTFQASADGSLSNPRHVSTGGDHARTFALSPDGGHVLVGNSNSMELTVFTFDDGVATLVDTIATFDANLFFVGFE